MSYWHFEISVKSAKRGLKSKIRVFSAEGAPQEVREVVYGGTIERQAIHVNGRASNGLLIRFCSPSHRDGVLFTSTLRMFLRLKFQALVSSQKRLSDNAIRRIVPLPRPLESRRQDNWLAGPSVAPASSPRSTCRMISVYLFSHYRPRRSETP